MLGRFQVQQEEIHGSYAGEIKSDWCLQEDEICKEIKEEITAFSVVVFIDSSCGSFSHSGYDWKCMTQENSSGSHVADVHGRRNELKLTTFFLGHMNNPPATKRMITLMQRTTKRIANENVCGSVSPETSMAVPVI